MCVCVCVRVCVGGGKRVYIVRIYLFASTQLLLPVVRKRVLPPTAHERNRWAPSHNHLYTVHMHTYVQSCELSGEALL